MSSSNRASVPPRNRLGLAAGDLVPVIKRHLNKVIIAVFFGIFFGGPLSILVGGIILIHQKEAFMDNTVGALAEHSDARDKATLTSFQALHAITDPPCTAAYLQKVRDLILSSDLVRDVIYQSEGRLLCSGVMSGSNLVIHGMNASGFPYSPEMTIWNHITLNSAPGRSFMAVSDGHFTLLILAMHYTVGAAGDDILTSHIYVNHEAGLVRTVQGPSLPVDLATLHTGSRFWRNGTYTTIGCASDGSNCVALSARAVSIIKSNIFPFGVLAAAGAIIGSIGSAIFLLWIYSRRSLAVRLRAALRSGELFLVYQPIVDANLGRIVAAEALMRWRTRRGSFIAPDLFVPAAEEAGFVGDLTRLAIATAGRDLAETLRAYPELTISINIVSDDLEDMRFHAALAEHIEGRGIPPFQIALELTERRAAQVEAASVILTDLRALGYKIYLDDFGTGYSNLSYLSDLTIDAIKLDRSFTRTVDVGFARGRLVPPILDMAREVDVPVIVEGVETSAQADFFKTHRVNLMQGWLFSPAVGVSELLAMLARDPGANKVGAAPGPQPSETILALRTR
jgi:sensor c-di-GMP phosphodiesterase-like protein